MEHRGVQWILHSAHTFHSESNKRGRMDAIYFECAYGIDASNKVEIVSFRMD